MKNSESQNTSLVLTRVCTKCKVEKTRPEFSSKSGRCKPCVASESAEWRKSNPERLKAASTKWRLENQHHINQLSRDRRANARAEKAAKLPENHPVGAGRFKDLTGVRFTELTVVKYLGSSVWECKCDCGATSKVHTRSLNSGNSKRCAGHKLPAATGTMSKLYGVWRGMMRRCHQPEHPNYPGYGGRGLTVCAEWHNYKTFRLWALESGYFRPEEVSRKEVLTIDRVDNYKGYSPDNCRWVKMVVQARNRREPTVVVEAFGQVLHVTDWANSPLCNVSPGTLRNRLSLGYPPEYALTVPIHETMSKSNPYRAPRLGRTLSLKVAMHTPNRR